MKSGPLRSPRPLRPLRFSPRKRFGQHFLEPAWVDKLIRVIDPRPDEDFLEIGPGRGALTLPLAARAKSVVAFEIDRDLAPALAAVAPPNVEIVEGDFLDVPLARLSPPDAPLRAVGNLPYNVASPILFHLIDFYRAGLPVSDATVMLQREVADRLTAAVGTKDYGVLTILVGHRASVERLLTLPPGAFRPAPKVRSAVVRLRFHPPEPHARDENVLAALVKAAFTRRRKTLANALLAFPGAAELPPLDALRRAGLDAGRRPETLSIAEWVRLSDVYASSSSSGRAVL
jgi:16S rRNA (adenine1518-N6/adenine1519-N6)-dimethyltransferase